MNQKYLDQFFWKIRFLDPAYKKNTTKILANRKLASNLGAC